MVLRMAEGFEGSTRIFSNKWNIPIGDVSLSGTGAEGGNSSNMANVTGYTVASSSTNDEMILGIRLRVASSVAASTYSWVGVGLGTRSQCSLRITRTSTGIQAQAYRQTGGDTAIGSAVSLGVSTDTFFYLQIRFLIDNSAGEVEVRVDDSTTPVLNIQTSDSISTQGLSASDQISSVHFYQADGFLFDDLYLLDTSAASGGGGQTSFLGPIVARVGSFTGVASSTGFSTVGAASADAAVSDDDPSTFNSSNTNGDQQEFSVADLSGLGATYYGVQVDVLARTAAVGSRQIRPKLGNVGGTKNGANRNIVSTSDAHTFAMFTEDAGNADFDATDIANMQPGYEITN